MIIDRDEDICFHRFFIVYVHSTLSAANIGMFIDSSSYNNCSLNSQEPYQGINKNPLIGMVSADSSVEPVRALFLVFTRGLTVLLTSPALTLTATAAQ